LQNIDYVSPFLHEVTSMIGKRWNFRVLWELRRHKHMRYNELLASLDGISPSTLAETLRYLEGQKLIKRASYGKSPPYRVEYMVTESGFTLLVASSPLIMWAIKKTF